MEDFLEDIYYKANLYTVVNELESWSNCGLIHKVKSILNEQKPFFQIIHDEDAILATILEEIYQGVYNRFLVSDLIGAELLPQLDQYLKQYQCIEVDADNGYKLESTAHGFLTLKDNGNLLHSMYDPMLEARNIVLKLFEPIKTSYSLLGCGMGYIAYQLYYISGGSVKIRIFEPNEYVADYAQRYGVLSWIPDENIEIIVSPDVAPFFESLEDEKAGYYIFKPELTRWEENVQKTMFKIFVDQNTQIQFKELYEINFYRNIFSNSKNIEELPALCKNNKCIVVAGGPSLDNSIDFIKKYKDSMTVISVGTSFKKLVNLGIKPDYVTIYDPTKLTMKQLEKLEDEDTKLIVATCAYWGWAKKYKGDKYLVPILDNDIQKTIWSVRSKTNGWYCGSTVTFLAIKLAEYLRSKEIYLVGADFAFPGNVTHAFDTPCREKINTDVNGFIDVISVNGESIKTDVPFNMYREQLEDFIQNREDITVYNMSTCGAYIKGAVDGRKLLKNS